MGNRTTIVILAVAAALVGFIFFFERETMTTSEREERADRVFGEFRRDRVDGLKVRGTGGVTVADQKRFNVLSRSLLRTIREYPYLKDWQSLGMLKAFPVAPVDVYERLKQRRAACVSCPVGCKDVVRIPDPTAFNVALLH